MKIGGGTVSFAYDASGNQLSGDGRTLSYSAFSQPRSIAAGGVTTTFSYGAELARYRQDKNTGESTLYIDKLMEVVDAGGTVEYRHYLGETALLTKTGDLNDPAPVIRFLHRDRLGSVVAVTEDAGLVEGRGYDPFGKPRDPDWADKVPPVLESLVTLRGFTAHEHLDESELIHMNGRVYDYRVGRFLSVDPLIQAPGNSQGLNPYAYLMNNPLAGTDPSGYCRTQTGSHICRQDELQSAKLSDISQIATYQGQDGERFAVATMMNGAQFQVQAISGPAAALDALGLGTSTTDINGLRARDLQSGGGGFASGEVFTGNAITVAAITPDTILDVGSVLYDLGSLAVHTATGNTAAAAADAASLSANAACTLVPVLTGCGIAVRAADKGVDVAKATTDGARFGTRSVGAAENVRGVVAGNLKKLSYNRLKNLGIDAEAVKKDLVGRAGGRYNLSVDEAGNVFLTPVRRGASEPVPAFSTLDELKASFPLE